MTEALMEKPCLLHTAPAQDSLGQTGPWAQDDPSCRHGGSWAGGGKLDCGYGRNKVWEGYKEETYMHELRELKTSDCRLKESRWQDWRLGQAVKETGLQP